MGGEETRGCNGSTEVVAQSVGAAAGERHQNRQAPLRIVIVNDVFDVRDPSPDAVLERFSTLTGWANAIQAHGANVLVCQRFHHDARISRSDVVYQFVADRAGARPTLGFDGNRQTRAAASSFDPAVVHVNGMDYPRALRRLRLALSPTTALVVQDHGGFDPHRLSWFRRAWLRRGLSAVNALLVSTAAHAQAFRDSRLVPNAVAIHDVMEASTTLRANRQRIPNGRLKLLWVGRLNANKDPMTVIDGFARFAATGADATLTFVYGTAELEQPLRDAINRNAALRDRVTLLGAVAHDKLADLYADADLLVLGSHREGSGYAVLEAMACGVVPVLTNIPSFRGLTDEGRAGELWDVGSPQSLADALTRVTSNRSLESMREMCRRRFDDCFSWRAIGARAVAIYRECSRR